MKQTQPQTSRNEYQREYNKNNRERIKKRKKEQRDALRAQHRERIKEYLGGEYRCNRCGFTHNTTTPFDWHHLNPEDKEISPMRLICSTWERLKTELDKCEFMCSNCHRILHHG